MVDQPLERLSGRWRALASYSGPFPAILAPLA